MSSLSDFDPTGDKALATLDPADFFSGRGAKKSEKEARETQDIQIDELRRQFDISQERLQPALEQAVPAFGLQSAISGAQGSEAQAAAIGGLQQTPDQAFAQEQAGRQLNTASAATGAGGGTRLRQLAELGTSFAQQGLSNQFNRLGTVAGTGQAAGTGLAGLGSRFAQDVGQVVQTGAQNQINAIGQAQQQRSQAAGTGLGVLAAFSDENMKDSVKDLTNKECYDLVKDTPIRTWKYLEECGIDREFHFGPMAQEAPELIKVDGKEALKIHDELWLIAGAMKYMMEQMKCQTA